MEELNFNSDERFLVPDSEDDDLNSREPWDLISGLEALTSSQIRFKHSPCKLRKSQAMSSPHKKENRVFPLFEASISNTDETSTKKTALAYDTISSDLDSGDSSHNQTVIERISTKRDEEGNAASTPSTTIGNLQFSQDVILVPETLDSLDVVGPSPKVHTAPFIVPDSPTQSQDPQDDSDKEKDAEVTFKALSSSVSSQSSNKIDSQGLHLHFSQSQLDDSSQTPGSNEQAEAMFGDRGVVTTPVKDPSSFLLSCRKLSLKDAPPSPQRKESLPRPSFHLPSKLLPSSGSENNETVERETTVMTDRSCHVEEESTRTRKKQPKKQRLFMDTEEETKGHSLAKSEKSFGGDHGKDHVESSLDANRNITVVDRESQPKDVASLVFTEESEASVMIVDVDHTISYEYIQSHDQSLDDKNDKPSVTGDDGNDESAMTAGLSKDASPSQGEFDGFDEGDETLEHNVMMEQTEKDEVDKNSRNVREDSPLAPSSQVELSGNLDSTVGGSKSISQAPGEVSTNVKDSINPDPYQFQESQSQYVADISNQPLTDRSRSFEKTGSRTKVVKVMRKVLKKKIPLKKDQKSSSTDESTSTRPDRSTGLRRKMSALKSRSKSGSKNLGESSEVGSNKGDHTTAPSESFTTIQSRSSNMKNAGNCLPPVVSQSASNEMPPPVARTDGTRKSAIASNETSPQDINKLSKKSTTVSFQDEFMPKTGKETPEPFGEMERKTVREFKAIVVERETTIDILDDKGNILRQTVTKEVTRTPVEPPLLAVSVQVTERILSPNVSPSRSVSTLTSGDLADVSSSSLSRSMSSGSKGSNPSLEFCSQNYPTAAQRSHPLESENNKSGGPGDVGGMITKTTKIIPSVSAKQDTKRSSSGSNTGQDLFGSPDMSVIPHVNGSSNQERPVVNLYSPAVQAQLMDIETTENTPKNILEDEDMDYVNLQKRKEITRVSKQSTSNLNAESTTSDALNEDRIPTAVSSKNKQQKLESGAACNLQSKGRGKRKMEEKSGPSYIQSGKRLRRQDEKVTEMEEEENVEASGSSVSTGFVVQDALPSEQASSHDKVTAKSKDNCGETTSTEKSKRTNIDAADTIEIKSRLSVGEQVMGKWTDGFYYPGVLKKIDSTSVRYQLKFDDGSQKWVGPDGLLLAKELPVGQSVMVLSEDDYYVFGMIMAHSWDPDQSEKEDEGRKALIYHVERDDGVTQKCQRKCLLLSEDQAACLMSDHDLLLPCDVLPATTPKKGDISLDNLVEGKRQHRTKSEKTLENDSVSSEKKSSAKVVASAEETPTVSHEATAVRSGKKRKVGPVATSTPTPKQSSSVTPCNVGSPLKTLSKDKLGSIVSSPSAPRKSQRKTRQVLFGKKLTPPSDLFKGYTFLLTHIDKTAEQRQEEKHLLGDSSLEDTSMDDNGDQSTSEESHPFIKDQLHSLILAGGGKVLDKVDMNEIQESGISHCYLVASEHQRTVKYLQALAANIRIVSHQWILHSIDQGRLLGPKDFLLPAGISLEKRKLLECKNLCSPLRGQTVLIVSSRDDFVEAWSSILSLAKCHLPTRFPARALKADPGIDYVLSDMTCPTAIVRKCQNLQVPLISSEWIAQCLINNTLVHPTSHFKYQHDYDS